MKRVESRRRASFWLLLALLAMSSSQASAQEVEVDRPEAPRLDPLEVDANGDGVPDGWYNPVSYTHLTLPTTSRV